MSVIRISGDRVLVCWIIFVTGVVTGAALAAVAFGIAIIAFG